MPQATDQRSPGAKARMTLARRLHRRGWLGWFCGGTLGQGSTGFTFTSLIAQIVILLFSTFWSTVVSDLVTRIIFGPT